jgi:hypothetical protein
MNDHAPPTGALVRAISIEQNAVAIASGGPLDLHEEISDPGPSGGCSRWPEHLRLRASTGVVVRGRCGASNLCEYCAKLAAVENSEVLQIDAMIGRPPEVWATLGTRTPEVRSTPFYRAREQVIRALKRRWPAVEYAAHVEFTTGYGERSGGKRRPHFHVLLKGIPASDVDAAREIIVRVWCSRVDGAEPGGQDVSTIDAAGGLMRYLSLHFQKESQKPPRGWRGHRFLHSRGYLAETTPEMREMAREQLRWRRVYHRVSEARDQNGVPAWASLSAAELDEWTDQIRELERTVEWSIERTAATSRDPAAGRRAAARRPLRASQRAVQTS